MTACSNKNRVSLCIIARNEEKNLGKCLSSAAKLVDEIVVVDTGSADRTRDTAKSYGARVFDFAWQDNFAAARNFSLQQATGDWILVLDADEYLDEATSGRIPDLTRRRGAPDAYLLPLKNVIRPRFGEYLTSLVLRLFRNSPDFRFHGKIHEQVIVPHGKQVEIAEEGPVIIHFGYIDERRLEKNNRNMKMLENALAEDPHNPYYHFYISTEYILRKDFENALAHVRQALAGIPEDVLLFRAAAVRNTVLCLGELGRLDEAEKLLKSEIEVYGQFPDFYYYLGNIHQERCEYTEAIESYNLALNIKKPSLIGCSISGSNGYKSLFYRGLCQVKLRRYFEAVDSFRAALADNPSFDIPLAELVKCLLFTGGPEECLKYLDREFHIVSPELHLLVGRLLYENGYPEAALSYVNKVNGLQNNIKKTMLLGEIELSRGNPLKAEEYFRAIPCGDQFYATALVFRCLCAWKLNLPADPGIISALASIGANRPAAALIFWLDLSLTGKTADQNGRLSIMAGENTKAYLDFGQDLFVKLLELRMYRYAEILGNWLTGIRPELKWPLAFLFRKSGALAQATRLQTIAPHTGSYSQSHLEAAKIYQQISAEFLGKIPVLPENRWQIR